MASIAREIAKIANKREGAGTKGDELQACFISLHSTLK